MNEKTLVVEESEPKQVRKKIVKQNGNWKDSLYSRFINFEVEGFAYEVDQIMKKGRRRIKLLGMINRDDKNVKIIELNKNYRRDKIGTPGIIFEMAGSAYKVNSVSDRRRTIKLLGKIEFEEVNDQINTIHKTSSVGTSESVVING